MYVLIAFLLPKFTLNNHEIKKNDVEIFVKSNGVHTDLVLPIKHHLKDWTKTVLFSDIISKDTVYQYLALGWGDKAFYLETPNWSDLKFKTAFNAAFGLSSTAIHATYYKNITENEKCKRLYISNLQYQYLISYIEHSFQKDINNNVINIKTNAQYGKTDAFYEATGHYSLFKSCNTWTNNALKICNLPCCIWVIFESDIINKY